MQGGTVAVGQASHQAWPSAHQPAAAAAGLAELLGTITLLRLRVALRPDGPVRLPPFLGATLRGALAGALRRVSCALPRERCESCLLRERCAYSYLFETPRPAGGRRLRGQASLPHPLVIDPPAARSEPYDGGEPLCFELTLFGRGADHLPHLVVALDQMARRGLGRERSPFELASIARLAATGDASPAYEPGAPLGPAPPERLAAYLGRRPPAARAAITFVTPTRIASAGRLTRTPAFADLVRSLATRALAMLHYHCGADVDLDLPGLTAAAAGARIEASKLRLERLRRRSSRQDGLVPLDGMVGSIAYAGSAVAELWPLLSAGEILHVGKGTVFGLGRYVLGATPSAAEQERGDAGHG